MQFKKTLFPILVTLIGILMEVRPVQPLKAPRPMLATLLGIMVFWHPAINSFVTVSTIALQLFLESYLGLSSSTFMEAKPVQPLKTLSPMLVTLLGIPMEVRTVQPSKALRPMLVTLLGISMEVKPVQPLNT